MTFTLKQHKAWCVHPTGDGPEIIADGGNCVGVIRRSWGQQTWGGSAKIWWESVPDNEKHWSHIKDVPEGAALWAPIGVYHHCWVAARDLEGWSTDYSGMGTFELAPMALPRWTGHKDRVWWTSWSRFGRLPVGKSWNELHPVSVPKPPTPNLVPVNLKNLKYGVRNNQDVKDLQRALNRQFKDANLPVTGNYLDRTDAAVRYHQFKNGFGLDPKRHSYVGRRQAAHLGLRPI